MAGRRRIPFAGGDVLAHRTLLEKHLAARIKHQHMHRAMPQPARMNLAPRVLPDHLVALVDDVKNFFGHGQNKMVMLRRIVADLMAKVVLRCCSGLWPIVSWINARVIKGAVNSY